MMVMWSGVSVIDVERGLTVFGLDLFALLVIAFVGLAAVAFVVIVVVLSVRASHNRGVALPAGAPTVQDQAQVWPPAGTSPIEARLHELDSLRARGVISYDEYVAARQRAIDGSPPS